MENWKALGSLCAVARPHRPAVWAAAIGVAAFFELSACTPGLEDHVTEPTIDASPAASDAASVDPGSDAIEAPVAVGPIPCTPTSGGPHWLEEGETLIVSISCQSGKSLPANTFQLVGLPAGATYDPATATLTWTPKLDQAGVYLVTISAPQIGETGEIKIGVADKFSDPMNMPITDLTKYTEEYGLPVIHMDRDPNLNEFRIDCGNPTFLEDYLPVTIVYRGQTYADAQAKIRGNFSECLPKKNYTIEFTSVNRFSEPLLGGQLLNRRKIMLITTFDDNSYLRNRMAFELWNSMDPRNIQIKTFSAVVFIKGVYHGLYTVTDSLDGNLMQRHGYRDDGNLYKAIDHNANFALYDYDVTMPNNEGLPKMALSDGYDKKEGTPLVGEPGAFSDLIDLIEFVSRSDAASFATELPKKIDVRDYVNWLVHGTALLALDTLAKNSFHYHDPLTSAPWRAFISDFNHSFGQTFETKRTPNLVTPRFDVDKLIYDPAGKTPVGNQNNIWRRLWNDPLLGPPARARYGELLRTTLKGETVLALFDDRVKEIASSARRDWRKWQGLYKFFWLRWAGRSTDITTPDQEMQYVRRWIADRWSFLATSFP